MRSGWLRLLQTHNRGLIFYCVSHRNTHTHIHTHARTGWISCRHHKPTASLIEFSFPITSSDDLITFPFDATHKNKRTLDEISLFSFCLSLSLSLSLCVSPSSVIADNLVVAFQMAGHDWSPFHWVVIQLMGVHSSERRLRSTGCCIRSGCAEYGGAALLCGAWWRPVGAKWSRGGGHSLFVLLGLHCWSQNERR